MGPAAPAWLTARPIAHRGLHDKAAGRWENTLSAAAAAVARGFAIECDVQLSGDGEAMVFHDLTLERLTREAGPVGSRSAHALGRLAIGGTADRVAALPAFLDAIDGRVPLICEIKSAFDGDMRLADRTLAVVGGYPGPVALKSFDPAIIRHLRGLAPAGLPLGIVAEARFDDPEWAHLGPDLRRDLGALAHFDETRPDFLSFWVADLPHAAATLMRAGLGRPVMTWTVRTPAERGRAARWADQMVFEGFVPDDMPQSRAFV